MLFAAYTDVMFSASQRASLFFLTISMQYPAQIIAPPIGAWLMNLDGQGGTPQVNMMVSLTLSVSVTCLIIFAFPETLDKGSKDKNPDPNTSANIAGGTHQSTPESGIFMWSRRRYATVRTNFSQSIAGVGVLNMLLLAVSIFASSTGIKSIDWFGLVQYPVIRFRWTFHQVCLYLKCGTNRHQLTLLGVVNLVRRGYSHTLELQRHPPNSQPNWRTATRFTWTNPLCYHGWELCRTYCRLNPNRLQFHRCNLRSMHGIVHLRRWPANCNAGLHRLPRRQIAGRKSHGDLVDCIDRRKAIGIDTVSQSLGDRTRRPERCSSWTAVLRLCSVVCRIGRLRSTSGIESKGAVEACRGR